MVRLAMGCRPLLPTVAASPWKLRLWRPTSPTPAALFLCAGKLTHQDSTGTSETLGRGSVQFMSAGTGITHSVSARPRPRPCAFKGTLPMSVLRR
jgi:hypothetical protein